MSEIDFDGGAEAGAMCGILRAKLAAAERERDEARAALAVEDRGHGATIDHLEHHEENINQIHAALGCDREWSNLHDRGECAVQAALDVVAARDLALDAARVAERDAHADADKDEIAALRAEVAGLRANAMPAALVEAVREWGKELVAHEADPYTEADHHRDQDAEDDARRLAAEWVRAKGEGQ
jgi:hypothetical protein